MGKKKQLKKLAKANIKVLESGKVKFSKGYKLNLKPFIKDSVENAIVSRLDGIISKEEVVVETEKILCDVTSTLTDEISTFDLLTKTHVDGIQTIVVSTTKKNIATAFDFLGSDVLGILLRTTTLGSIYKELRDKWVDLNKGDESNFTNILYIPKIMMFININTGELRKIPVYLNLLLVVTPGANKMGETGIEEVSDEDATARVIADITEAVIKCGCKDIVLNPYCNKITRKDLSLSAGMWFRVTSGMRFLEQVDSCVFSIENEEDYIIFNAAKKPLLV